MKNNQSDHQLFQRSHIAAIAQSVVGNDTQTLRLEHIADHCAATEGVEDDLHALRDVRRGNGCAIQVPSGYAFWNLDGRSYCQHIPKIVQINTMALKLPL